MTAGFFPMLQAKVQGVSYSGKTIGKVCNTTGCSVITYINKLIITKSTFFQNFNYEGKYYC